MDIMKLDVIFLDRKYVHELHFIFLVIRKSDATMAHSSFRGYTNMVTKWEW